MKRCILLGFFMMMSLVVHGQTRAQLRDQLKTAPHDTVRLRLYIEISNTFFREDQYDSLRKVVEQALPTAYRSPARVYLGKLIYRMGLYYRNKGLFEKSLQEMGRAERLFAQIGDTTNLSHVKYAIAMTLSEKGDYKEGLAKALTNLTYFLKIKNTTYERYTYSALVDNYSRLKDRRRQRYYTEKFIQLAQKNNDPHELVIAYSMQAAFYEEQENYPQGWQYRKKALETARIIKRPITLVPALQSMAANLRKQHRSGEAIPHLQEALAISRQTNDKGLQGVVLQEMSLNYLQQGDQQRALHLAREAVATLHLIYGPKEYAESLKNLATVQETTGHYQQALKTYKTHQTITDSLLSAERTEKVAQIQAQYDLEKKEATILLLSKNAQLQKLKTQHQHNELLEANTQLTGLIASMAVLTLALLVIIVFLRQRTRQKQQIEIQARQLQENNALKDQIFAIIGHDLRSPIASIKNSLVLMKIQDQPTVTLDEIENQVNGLHNTLDNLLYWSLNQQERIRVVPHSVNLSDLVYDALEAFEGLVRFKKLIVTTDLKDVVIRVDENLALLVLRNILHNAFKYTPEGGAVRITFRQEPDWVHLVITDTGIGMDTGQVDQPATKGRGTGLGLQVSRDLMALNGGQLRIESQLGNGTTVTMSWPHSELGLHKSS